MIHESIKAAWDDLIALVEDKNIVVRAINIYEGAAHVTADVVVPRPLNNIDVRLEIAADGPPT